MPQKFTVAVLSLEYEIDYSLIGIHSAEKGYRLAFLFNKFVNILFKKREIGKKFELFEYEDKHNFVTFFLLKNKYISETKTMALGIFEEEIAEISYVIPEKKRADYFLKIDDCDSVLLHEVLQKIKKIKEVQTSYIIDVDTLKSKDNLIF